MSTPIWSLAGAYWLHMIATVLWIGGLTVFSLVVLPSAKKTLDNSVYAQFLGECQRRLDPIGWVSIIVLAASGMLQMSANPYYEGFLSMTGLWSGVILIKHIFFGGMVVLSGYITWKLMPALRRVEMLHALGKEGPDAALFQKRLFYTSRANLILGIVVLLLTSIARAA